MRQSLVLLQSFPVLSENAREIQKCAGAVQAVPLDRRPIGGFSHMIERGKLNHSLCIGFLSSRTPQDDCSYRATSCGSKCDRISCSCVSPQVAMAAITGSSVLPKAESVYSTFVCSCFKDSSMVCLCQEEQETRKDCGE